MKKSKCAAVAAAVPFVRRSVPNVNVTVANALRRTLLTSVPTYAISEVSFHVNTTCEGDEFIAHRLGLIPIRCELDEESSGATRSESPLLLYTPVADINVDVSCEEGSPCIDLTAACLEHVNFKPVYPHIPIVTIPSGARIAFSARIARGVASEHSKWSPVSKAIFRPLPSFNLDIEDLPAISSAVAAGCPKRVFSIVNVENEKERTKQQQLRVTRPEACTLCKKCVSIAPDGAITIAPDGGASANDNIAAQMYIAVHPVGQMSAQRALDVAFKRLREKMLAVADFLATNDGSCILPNSSSSQEEYL